MYLKGLSVFVQPRLSRSLAMQAWRHVAATDAVPEHVVFDRPMQKPLQDDREYRVIRLPHNGLHATLISDPNADKAAASLNVRVGHLSDPDDMPGLAHFCEHLLFMGTKNFPKENEYSEYISAHGGHTNAFTAASDTNYYFSVGAEFLPGALERFSAFFYCPLFAPSCTTRELNAVDSEHKKNLQADSWRLYQVSKSLSKPGHIWGKFGSGNLASLTAAARKATATNGKHANGTPNGSLAPTPATSRAVSPAPSTTSENDADGGHVGRETRRRLVEWWEQQYCASRMNVAIVGKESLDELTRLAVENFSPIKNRGLGPVQDMTELPWGDAELGTTVYMKTIMDFRAVELQFQLPSQSVHWRSKPGQYLTHLLGHEGPGSIHSYLKQRGWVVRLSAGSQVQARGVEFFKIAAFVTPEGLKRYREVVLVMFKYLNMLRSSSFPDYLYQETKSLAETRFDHAEKRPPDSYATHISDIMQRPYAPEYLLTGGSLLFEWDEGLVRGLLKEMVPEKARILVMAKEHEISGPQDQEWLKEKWYGTEYQVQKLDKQFLKDANQPDSPYDLHLPLKNEFIPTNLNVDKQPVDEPLKKAINIRENPLSRLWHKKDDQFWVPKANVLLYLRSPLVAATPRHSVRTRLYCDLVTDALTEYAYDAELAGVRYLFASDVGGLHVHLSGYNDKLTVLLVHVLQKIKSIEFDAGRFADMKEQLRLEYKNYLLGQPYDLANYNTYYVLSERMWTPEDKLSELDDVTLDEIQAHVPELLSRLHIEGLVHGNMSSGQAIEIMETAERELGAKPLRPSELITGRSHILPEASSHRFEMGVPNKDDVNSGLSYFLHIGDRGDEQLRAKLNLFAQLAQEPCFNQLRTQEQLGYIVSLNMLMRTGLIGLRVHVQSEKYPDYLEGRVEQFLRDFGKTLAEMPDEEFEKHKTSLITRKLEKPKNLAEEAGRLWGAIDGGYYDFKRLETDVTLLRPLTKQDILDFYSVYIDPGSATRTKLSVYLQGHSVPAARFSVAAANKLLAILQSRGVPIDVKEYETIAASEPPVESVKEHITTLLSLHGNLSKDVLPTLLTAVDRIAEEHPFTASEPTAQVQPTPSVLIQDVATFKASLPLSKAAVPVADD